MAIVQRGILHWRN